MASPRQGRAGFGGYSPRLGARDPRLRTNAANSVGASDLDPRTLRADRRGRTRIKAADGLKELPATATEAERTAAYNTLVRRLQGKR